MRRVVWVVVVAAAGLVGAAPAEAQTGWLSRAGNAIRGQFDSGRPRVFRRSIELEDASLETLKSRLGWIGIDLPLELEGDVTARLGVEIDLSSPRDARSYRINGSLSSKRVVVEGLELRNLSATARYVNGTLTLEELVATVPDPRPGAPAGRAAGQASMQLIPVGALTASLRLSGVPLEPLSRRVEAAGSLTGGRLTGRVSVEAPVSNLRDVKAWRGMGEVSLADLVAAGRSVSRAETGLEVADGVLTFRGLGATIEGEGVTGSGTLNLAAPFRYQASVAVPRGELSRVEALLKQNLPEAWAGGYELTAKASGALRPFAVDAAGTLAGANWTAAGTPVSSFRADVRSNGKAVTLSKLDVAALGGRWTGDGRVALAAPYGYRAALSLAGLDLAEARELPAAFDPGVPLRGMANAKFKADGTLEPRVVNATGEVTIDRLGVRDVAFDSARLVGRLGPEAVELTALEFNGPDGRLAGSGTVRLGGHEAFEFRLRPERFDLAALDPVLNVALRGEGEARRVVAYRGEEAEGSAPVADAPGSRPQEGGSAAGTQLGGKATGEVAARGEALPFKLDALNGSLAFENLVVAGVEFDRAEVTATTEGRTLLLSRLLLVKGEGRLSGEGRFGLDAPGAFNLTVRPERFAIDEARPLFGAGVAGVSLPPVSGRLDGTLTAAGQTQPMRIESLNASVAGDDVRIGRLVVNRFEVAAATQNDVVTVSNLLVAIGDGRLTGTATLGLKGEQAFEATLRPERFRIELLRPLFGGGGVIETDFPPVSGRVSGDVTLRGRLAPVEVQGVSGRVSAAGLTVSGVPIERAGFAVATEGGTARVREFVAETGFGRLTGAGTVGLAAPYPYAADLAFDDFDLAEIGRLTAGVTEEQRPDIQSPREITEGRGSFPIKLRGLADVSGNVRGSLAPFVMTGDGRVASDRLELDPRELSRSLRRATLTAPRFAWRYNENRLTLADISAGLGRGRVSGTAAVPLGAAAVGSLDLRVESVELARVLKLPGDVAGIASGTLDARLGPADENGDRAMSGTAHLSVPELRAGRALAGNVTADVGLNEDVLRYDVAGRVFDGTLAAKGTWPIDEAARDRGAGRVRWEGASLVRAAAVMTPDPTIAGRLDAAVDYDLAAATKATGTVELSDVRQKGDLVTDRLRARVVWADSVIRVENAAGGFAGGSVSFAVQLDANDPGRGTVEVLVRRADAQRAFGWIPGLEPLTGTADLRLRGRLGDIWRWQGDGEVTQGTYGPLGFSSWRVPLEIDASPGLGAMRIRALRTSVRSSGGRGTLNVTVAMGASPRLDVDGTFAGLDAGQLLEGYSDRIPGGRVSGTVNLSSRNLRTLADLDGRVTATLRGSQARNLPVIGSVVDVARIPTGGGGTIDRGEMRAYLRNGVARVEDLTLSGPSFRLYAEGTVALASERLGLDVVVDTSPARQDRLVAAFLLREVVDYATPLGWLERANRFIAERAVYLRVTGTVRRPVVRVRPVEQLEQEAVRFFLNELVAPGGPSLLNATP